MDSDSESSLVEDEWGPLGLSEPVGLVEQPGL